jgi:hypothetical protein
MAEQLNQFTRRIKTFYEKIYNKSEGQGIDRFLFPNRDEDPDSSNFALDSLVKTIHGVVFRNRGENSVIRPYEPGVGTIYEIERASEKTPITERLRDAVIVGGEETEAFSSREARMIQQILTQHTVAHDQTRWKLAIDVIRTGKFSPVGIDGNDIGFEIDFSRDASLDITYDFTASGATMNTALKALYDAYRTMGGPGGNLCVLMGSQWLKQFEEDDDVIENRKANSDNVLVMSNMIPPQFNGTGYLYMVSRYRIPGTSFPLYVSAYEPDVSFVAYKGATAAAFVPSDECLMFSLSSPRYHVIRGVDVLDTSGKAMRTSGDIVFDSFTIDDPVQTYMRSQARYAFIPGDVNHTARSTGTFSES